MKCSHCGSTQNLHKYSTGSYKRKQYFYCTKCATERIKRYRLTKKGKEVTQKAVIKYELNHPERRIAWNISQKLEKGPCIKCGKLAHKHHPDINKPLEVIYLCPLHHKQEHKKIGYDIINL